jgi:hypothetical protein
LAAGIRRVLDDPVRAGKMAADARRMAFQEHTWDRRARTLTELLEGSHVRALAG